MSKNTIEKYIDNISLLEIINQLEETDRKIIILYYFWGYKDGEIGKKLALSQQTVNYKRQKNIKVIKRQLNDS